VISNINQREAASLQKPQLLGVESVAAMLDASTSHVRRLADGGKMPRPLKLGASVRWNRIDLENWIAGGCKAVRATKGR